MAWDVVARVHIWSGGGNMPFHGWARTFTECSEMVQEIVARIGIWSGAGTCHL